jgi:DNA helicase-2/ATP-dependent DNA helicase PcrA
MPWDEGLEGSALQFAGSDESPIRTQAGPGTGKSFGLRRRIARLLEEGISPERILLVTFTRVSAGDLERELGEIRHPGVQRVRKGTIHALAFRLLNQANVLNFTGRVPRPLMTFEERFLIEDLGREDDFGYVHERKRRLKAFEAAWAREHDQEPGWPEEDVDRRFQLRLREWLRFHEAMLIGELIPVTLSYLRSNPGTPELRLFDHVLVDEYQDLNRAEQSLIDMISSHGNLAVVGDEDQSVYEDFRYAHPEGISEFHETHEGTHDIPLELSRRCPTNIVEIANSLIQNNLRRTGRVLQALPDNIGGDIRVVQWHSMEAEADGIASFIGEMLDSGDFSAGNTLVLCPRRQFGYLLRDVLRERGYPAQSFFHEEALEGNPKIIDDSRGQRSFTLLNLLANPDDRVSLRCWLGFGSPSLGASEYQRLRNYCANEGILPRAALDMIVNGDLRIQYTTHVVGRYRNLLHEIEQLEGLAVGEALNLIFPEGEDWAEPFRLIVQEYPDDESLSEVLDSLRVSITQPELPRNVEYVRIMSLHKSKGLNADLVIICGLVEGLLPSSKEGLTFEEERRYLEEQRRLFYVGITRTRRTLVLSSVLSLPRALAHRMKAQMYGGDEDFANTITSSFMHELGPSCPMPILGDDWEYN